MARSTVAKYNSQLPAFVFVFVHGDDCYLVND